MSATRHKGLAARSWLLAVAAMLLAVPDRAAGTTRAPTPKRACTAKFTVSTTGRNYADSVQYCKSIGMTIASIHSAAENTAVKRLLKTVSYLGATEIKNGGSTAKHWKWDDGTKWDYAASNDGLKSGGESRVAFSTGNPQWHDWCVRSILSLALARPGPAPPYPSLVDPRAAPLL